ncbi:GNAT family N-acetyltransferase [Fulvivirga lutea]|uniref:GNAT family N-acetyltransferase n=1 Tax=Fulvivirga lutea TaxID=2810512 RepID=A0A974WIJ3_9BACT|nr:GNAT family N-acetyltransferase [Fulvivirga lutea]QSE98805.1 GNAT family N-acetyltransferase [Fulvivirga lutea]
MKQITENINNLVSLWNLGGKLAGQLFANQDYSMSVVKQSEWPNKLWFHRKPDQPLMDEIQEQWKLNNISIAIWDNPFNKAEDLLTSNGFELKNELTGMSVSLKSKFRTSDNLDLVRVNNLEQAVIWSDLFLKAFGYQITVSTIINTMHMVNYFIAHSKEKQVGTAVLYQDNLNVIGIHSMGIIPEQRRKGYAKELLHHVLSIAEKKGATLATLQASEMGKGLYLKTGFKEDFKLKNFIKSNI